MLSALPMVWSVSFGLVLGLLVGSFLNVVIHRLPQGESIVSPGSRCPECQVSIRPWQNIPVFSYLWLRGRCGHCECRISPRYPLLELLTGVLFAAMAWRWGLTAQGLLFMAFTAALVAAAAIDFDLQIIPDEISLGGLAAGLLLSPLVQTLEAGVPYTPAVLQSVIGAFIGGGVLWSVGFLHARISVATGRTFPHWPGEGESLPRPRDADYWLWFPGLGLGDVKLLAMIGAFVGPLGVIDTLLAASVVGLVVGVALGVFQRNWKTPFGFGPSIAGGAILVIILPLHPLVVGSVGPVPG